MPVLSVASTKRSRRSYQAYQKLQTRLLNTLSLQVILTFPLLLLVDVAMTSTATFAAGFRRVRARTACRRVRMDDGCNGIGV